MVLRRTVAQSVFTQAIDEETERVKNDTKLRERTVTMGMNLQMAYLLCTKTKNWHVQRNERRNPACACVADAVKRHGKG